MPTSVAGLLVGAGVLLILASLFGGGLILKDIKIPTIAMTARVIAFVVGTLLIGLGLYPEFRADDTNKPGSVVTTTPSQPDTSSDSSDDEPSITSLAEAPNLIGMTRSEAAQEAEREGLALGSVTAQRAWVADGTVIEQTPDAHHDISDGETIDIVLADSSVQFRAERRATTKEKERRLEAVSEYHVRRLKGDESGDLGELVVTHLEVSPLDGEIEDVVESLLNTPAYAPMDKMTGYKISDHWERFAELKQTADADMTEKMVLDDRQSAIQGLGAAVLLGLLEIEAQFDLRAIVSPPPSLAEGGRRYVVLQEGTEVLSTIRVEGPGGIVAAGAERAFDVTRRAPDEERYRRIGRAIYSVEDGLLRRLIVSFSWGDEDDAVFYRLEIGRL